MLTDHSGNQYLFSFNNPVKWHRLLREALYFRLASGYIHSSVDKDQLVARLSPSPQTNEPNLSGGDLIVENCHLGVSVTPAVGSLPLLLSLSLPNFVFIPPLGYFSSSSYILLLRSSVFTSRYLCVLWLVFLWPLAP